MEALMRREKCWAAAGLLLAAMILTGVGSLLSACNTVSGAGQDVSAVGRTVTTGAEQTKRATGIP
jgi:predicted small secreted protein